MPRWFDRDRGMTQVRVLVVEDSAFMRRRLTSIIESDPGLVVVGIARNGEDAVERVRELQPDVITLDITMPRMDGLTVLIRIMMECPTPTIIVSSLTQDGASTTLEALELGAVDFVAKPSGTVSLDIDNQREEIVAKIRGAAEARVGRRRSSASLRRQAGAIGRAERSRQAGGDDVPSRLVGARRVGARASSPTARAATAGAIIAIGVSTGGPQALLEILPSLPRCLPVPVVIVQHMPPAFTGPFAHRLDAASAVSVKEAEHGERLMAGTVYVGPGGYQMTVAKSVTGGAPRIRLSHRPRGLVFCPSVDVLFDSVAWLYGRSAVGVLLTGLGDDGADGMVAIRRAGGATIAESDETAVVFGMPRVAIERGGADVVAPVYQVADRILDALREKTR